MSGRAFGEGRRGGGVGRITAAAFLSQGLVGLLHTVFGAALPQLRLHFGIGLEQAGRLGSLYWAGFMLAVLAAGVLSDALSRTRVLAAACLLAALGSLGLGRTSGLLLNALLVFAIGAGTGGMVSSSSALLVELYPGREGPVMSLHHFFYALGAIAGPLAVSWFVERAGRGWLGPYRLGGSACLAAAAAFLFFRPAAGGRAGGFEIGAVARVLGEARMALLIGLALLAAAAQNGVVYWLVSFLRAVRAFPAFQAGLALSLLSIGLGAGRLSFVWLAAKLGASRCLLVLFASMSAALLLLLVAHDREALLALCFLAGFGFSAVFPLLLALGGRSFPGRSGTALGVIATASGLGSTLMPWAMSRVAQPGSLTAGMALAAATAVAGLILVAAFSRRLRLPPAGGR